jgi:hypothetical protein
LRSVTTNDGFSAFVGEQPYLPRNQPSAYMRTPNCAPM